MTRERDVAVAMERLCKAARYYSVGIGDAATLRLALHDAAHAYDEAVQCTYGKVLRAAKKTRKR